MKPEIKIILELWELEREWNEIADPQFNSIGMMTYHNPNDQELFRLVKIQDRQDYLKKELRYKLRLWNYIKYLIAPVKFTNKLLKTIMKETKKQRLERQTRQYASMIEQMKKEMGEMFTRKVQRDAYFINHKFNEEVK